MRTQVAIVGAGPSGLLLGQLLHRAGIENVVLEQRTSEHVLGRIRAGVLEQGAVAMLGEAGVGERLHAEGLVGLNLAASNVRYLFDGLVEHYRHDRSNGLDAYSERALRRIWKAERFSWWMTMLLHRFPEHGPFGDKIQQAELDYLFGSHAALTALAENYVGLPY